MDTRDNTNAVSRLRINTTLTPLTLVPLQTALPLLDEVAAVSARLEAELGSVAAVFSSFLECVQKLRDSAVNTQSNGESINFCNQNTMCLVYNGKLMVAKQKHEVIFIGN